MNNWKIKLVKIGAINFLILSEGYKELGQDFWCSSQDGKDGKVKKII
jgi:hypothetical protein